MVAYPLPPQLTRDQFHSLVTDLYYQLTDKGLDPASNLTVEDVDELLDDGTARSRFAIFISEPAAQLLKHKPN